MRGVHCRLVDLSKTGFGQRGLARAARLFVTVRVSPRLDELDAAAMAMHVAKASDVHQDVEAQPMAGREAAQQLIVTAAMLRAERAYLCDARSRQSSDGAL